MRKLASLGELSQDTRIPEWWVSKPVAVPFFNGQRLPFTITVDATDDVYSADVIDAVRSFLALGSGDRELAAPLVFKNFTDFADAVSDLDVEIDDAAKVWEHVKVTQIYVDRRHRRDQDVYVKVACECGWEVEHGLQLIFRRGSQLIRVSEQDGHLTHADADDLPE